MAIKKTNCRCFRGRYNSLSRVVLWLKLICHLCCYARKNIAAIDIFVARSGSAMGVPMANTSTLPRVFLWPPFFQ